MTEARYFLYGDRPVKMEVTSEGALRVSAFDPVSGQFIRDTTYRARILHDRDNMTRELNRGEFDREVKALVHASTSR